MDQQHQSQPLSSPSPSPSSPGGGGGEESAKRQEEEELNSETKSKSAVRCKNTFFGRHRLSAAITRLQNEINIIKEELQQLESTGESSIVCRELVSSVESIPDPLLSETIGPTDVNWDQWFRGAHGSRNHRRWI